MDESIKYILQIHPGRELSGNRIAELLTGTGAIRFGRFTLTSGKESDYYVDVKEAITDPANLRLIAGNISDLVEADKIAGVELGAVPLLVASSIQTGKSYMIIRKERKHGTKSLIIGNAPKGASVDLIEDVVTTGNSVLKAVNYLRELGCVVKRCICVVDREEGGAELLGENGIELLPLVKISSVLDRKNL